VTAAQKSSSSGWLAGAISYPTALAVSGSTAIVLDSYAGRVSLVNLRTRRAYRAIRALPRRGRHLPA
jgi:hypothetical protein